MGTLQGKVIAISGGARGMGEAEARLFVAEGARVMLGDILEDEGRREARIGLFDEGNCDRRIGQRCCGCARVGRGIGRGEARIGHDGRGEARVRCGRRRTD
jgi:NAD(P)-dependent dehydrogenase (short-subunit alcohol dehydrogenase family)